MIPEILYEDNHLIAVLKPPGLLTQGDISGAPSLLGNVKEYIKRRDNKPGNVYLGMFQRLDRPVSGVIFFAKTSKAAARMSKQIRNREVEKIYTAVTSSQTRNNAGADHWIECSACFLRQRDKTIIVPPGAGGAQNGVLCFRTLFENHHLCFHMIQLITGRKHQIRAQFAHLQMPIAGDLKYGSRLSFTNKNGIGLHAASCSIVHPVKQVMLQVTAMPPDDMLGMFSPSESRQIRAAYTHELNLLRGERSRGSSFTS